MHVRKHDDVSGLEAHNDCHRVEFAAREVQTDIVSDIIVDLLLLSRFIPIAVLLRHITS